MAAATGIARKRGFEEEPQYLLRRLDLKPRSSYRIGDASPRRRYVASGLPALNSA